MLQLWGCLLFLMMVKQVHLLVYTDWRCHQSFLQKLVFLLDSSKLYETKYIKYNWAQTEIWSTGKLNYYAWSLTHCMWCHLKQVARLALWHCQQLPKSASFHQTDRQPTWMPNKDSTSGPALKCQEVRLVSLIQRVTFVVLPGKENQEKVNDKKKSKVTKSGRYEDI